MVKVVEPLRELAGMQPQRRTELVQILLLQPVEEHAQARELPMQPYAGPPQATEASAHVRLGVAEQHPLLDSIDLGAESVDHAVHGISDFVDDLLEQCGNGIDTVPAFCWKLSRDSSSSRAGAGICSDARNGRV